MYVFYLSKSICIDRLCPVGAGANKLCNKIEKWNIKRMLALNICNSSLSFGSRYIVWTSWLHSEILLFSRFNVLQRPVVQLY